LYPNKHYGDAIAAEATKRDIQFMRIDRNAPYPKTPLIRWLETCAAWCAGGWELGEPRFSDVLNKWQAFWYGTKSDSELRPLRQTLVRFLFDHRHAELPLKEWIRSFARVSLRDMFGAVPVLRDELEYVKKLYSACENGKPLEKWTVARFGGQLGAIDQ